MEIAHRSGSGLDLGVKGFLDGSKLEIGHADIGVDGKKRAELLEVLVKSPYRHRGIGSKMLKFMVDYLQDGDAREIHGDITASNDLRKTIEFFTKNGFTIGEELTPYGKHTVIDIALTQPKFGQFFNLHNVERVIGKKSIPVK